MRFDDEMSGDDQHALLPRWDEPAVTDQDHPWRPNSSIAPHPQGPSPADRSSNEAAGAVVAGSRGEPRFGAVVYFAAACVNLGCDAGRRQE